MRIVKQTVPADIRFEINRLRLKEQQNNNMVAIENIPAGRYFNVGQRCFQALTTIVRGEAYIPGQNCEEIRMAEALNELNEETE